MPPSDRKILAYEFDLASPEAGRIFASDLDTTTVFGTKAKGFEVTTNPPSSGLLQGDTYFSTSKSQGLVWDGVNWRNVAPAPMSSYVTKNDLFSDTVSPNGAYAVVTSTGELYVKTNNNWKALTIQKYNTYNDLQTDASQPEATLGLVTSEDSFWIWDSATSKWNPVSTRGFVSLTDLQNWTPDQGSFALDKSTGIKYVYLNGNWQTISTWVDTESNILSSTDKMAGQLAISSDTNAFFVYTGTNWVSSNVKKYTTESSLLADSAPDGTFAVAIDNNILYVRGNNVWTKVNNPQIVVSTNAPTNPSSADFWYNPDMKSLFIHANNSWDFVSVCYERAGSDPPPTSDRVHGHFFEDNRDGSTYINSNTGWKEMGLIPGTPNLLKYVSGFEKSAEQISIEFPTSECFEAEGYVIARTNCFVCIIAKNNNSWVNWSNFTHGKVRWLEVESDRTSKTWRFEKDAEIRQAAHSKWDGQYGGRITSNRWIASGQCAHVQITYRKVSANEAFLFFRNHFVSDRSSTNLVEGYTFWRGTNFNQIHKIGLKMSAGSNHDLYLSCKYR